MYCSREEFLGELKSNYTFLDTIKKVGNSILMEVSQNLRKLNENAELLFVGSTNPNRLTTVLDSKAPDLRYQCDFDLAVIVPQNLSPEREEVVLQAIFPDGKTVHHWKRVERFVYRQKFPVSAVIIPESLAKSNPPIVYTLKHSLMSEDEAEQVRALRLFMMRNGLYGGFTRGFKGIALEQLIKNFENFDNSIQALSQSEDLRIPSPLDGYNLTDKLSLDIRRRLRTALGFASLGKFRAIPYSFDNWCSDHKNSLNYCFQTSALDPYEIFKMGEKIASKSVNSTFCGKINQVDSSVLVTPFFKAQQLFFSFSGIPSERSNFFQSELRRRWDLISN